MIYPKDTTGLLWIAFGIYWLVRAFSVHKTVYSQPVISRAVQFILWTAAFALMYSDRIGNTSLAYHLYDKSNITTVAGSVMTAAGLVFAGWARLHLGAYWSSTVTLKSGHQLIRSGPYGLTRHPIYTGIVLAFIGTAIAMGEVRSLLAFAVLMVAIAKKIQDEEVLLQNHFAGAYQKYRDEVSMIVPWLW